MSVLSWRSRLTGTLLIVYALSALAFPITVELRRDEATKERRAQALMKLKLRQSSMLQLLETGSSTSMSVAAHSREVPLEEEILTEKHLATYFGRIGINGHPFSVLFDTGSCEFWVPSEKCQTARCMRHSRYPHDANRRLASSTGMNIQV